MSMIKEFKEFIANGNVVDLAVAVILGGAFQKIVDSVVNDLIMPLIAMLGGLGSIEELAAGPFTYGKFLAATINFLIIAFILFLIIKAINKTKK